MPAKLSSLQGGRFAEAEPFLQAWLPTLEREPNQVVLTVDRRSDKGRVTLVAAYDRSQNNHTLKEVLDFFSDFPERTPVAVLSLR